MYDVEVFVGEPYPLFPWNKEPWEAMEHYEETKFRINLTRIWQLAGEEYRRFLLELIGAIVHEYLHLFFHGNRMFEGNREDEVGILARHLKMLSAGHLIGVESKVIKQLFKDI